MKKKTLAGVQLLEFSRKINLAGVEKILRTALPSGKSNYKNQIRFEY